MHRMAYLLCGDWHLANDLVQEALARAFRHWRRVQRADNPEAYVRRIVLNEMRRHWHRHRYLVPRSGSANDDIPAPDAYDHVVRRTDLMRALQSLPERQRATVVLRYLEGLSERETAEVLGCSEGTVKSQSSRALHTLKSILDRQEMPI